jgi:uncharacterized protein YndB with AHSA1/START domain
LLVTQLLRDGVPGPAAELLNSLTLELDRVLPASREAVFAAFTDPEQVARWFGPKGFAMPSLEFPARVGDSLRMEMKPPDGDSFFIAGEFLEVEAPARLAFTFRYEDPDPDDIENTVRLSFRQAGNSTDARLTQAPFRTDARLDLHREGWGDSFDRLERLLR